MTLGQRIVTLRTDKAISQGQLAQMLGVSRQAVSKWENDQSSPDTRNLILMTEILDTDLEYLATGIHPVYEKNPVMVNVVETVEKIVEKPVYRVKYRTHPLLLASMLVCGFVIGILIGIWL